MPNNKPLLKDPNPSQKSDIDLEENSYQKLDENDYINLQQKSQKEEDETDKKEEEDKGASLTNSLEDKDLGEAVNPVERDSIIELTEDDSFSQPKSYASILAEEFVHARNTFKRSSSSVFTSAIVAGLEIGISFIMLLTVYALLVDLMPTHYALTLASLLYPIGFIAVVIGQSILYTEQTSLLSLPVLAGIEPPAKLAQIWGVVIIGNIVGGCLFSIAVGWLGIQMGWFDESHISYLADHVLDYPWWILLGSSIVAGWLMGIAAWLATSARDTLSRVLLVALITACIGVLGLHHSIVGNIEVFSGLIFGNTSLLDYIGFLIWALIGNTIGGVVFVSILKSGSLKYDIEKLTEERMDEIREHWYR